MPIYEYRCLNGHTFEVIQSMYDDPVASCEARRATVERAFHPVAVHFKGSGFYSTDYGKGNRRKSDASKDGGSESGSGDKKDTPEKKESRVEKKAAEA